MSASVNTNRSTRNSARGGVGELAKSSATRRVVDTLARLAGNPVTNTHGASAVTDSENEQLVQVWDNDSVRSGTSGPHAPRDMVAGCRCLCPQGVHRDGRMASWALHDAMSAVLLYAAVRDHPCATACIACTACPPAVLCRGIPAALGPDAQLFR